MYVGGSQARISKLCSYMYAVTSVVLDDGPDDRPGQMYYIY